jgi:hypothetical protein
VLPRQPFFCRLIYRHPDDLDLSPLPQGTQIALRRPLSSGTPIFADLRALRFSNLFVFGLPVFRFVVFVAADFVVMKPSGRMNEYGAIVLE